MIWHLFFVIATGALQALYTALPPWSITFGPGTPVAGNAGTDGGTISELFTMMAQLDKFAPVHDGFLPWLTIVGVTAVGFIVFKAVKFLLSLIPTISAGG